MKPLRQSTAISIPIGPFLDDTDGKTPETALTVASIDVDIYKGITKSDLTITASGGVNDMAHVANGFYSLELTTGNTDTLGHFKVSANISGALPVWEDFQVFPSNVFDALFAGSDKLQVDATEWLGTALASPDTAGYPAVTLKVGTGAGEVNLSSGAAPVYDLTTAALNDIWTTVITEAYAADGAAATPAQLLYMLFSALSEFSIGGTTITAKKLDGSTTAMTFTLNDATNPTSRTRAT